jgi:predicted O-linked N-acetylglucosamine transferase (SPINDLY family)
MLESALQHYRKGELQVAEQLYLQVLQASPDQVEALHIMAVITGQSGRAEQAISYLRKVLALRPGWADAHSNLGMVYITQGRLVEAAASFQEAVRLQPDFTAAHNNLGNLLRELGRPAEGAASLEQAIRVAPGYAEAHYNLGLCFQALNRPRDALASFLQAARLKPNYPDAHFQLGMARTKLGRHDEAADSFRQVLSLRPDHAEARIQLGFAQSRARQQVSATANNDATELDVEALIRAADALVAQRNLPEAVCTYQQALSCHPDSAKTHTKLGHALWSLGQADEAEASLTRAIQLAPNYAGAHFTLGLVLQKQRRLESALASFQTAARLEPQNADNYVKIGNVRKAQGRLDDAIDAFRIARTLNPEDPHAHSALAFTLSYHPRYDARAVYEEYIRWNCEHAEQLGRFIEPHSNRPDAERRLRIGYVSPDFHEHACTCAILPLLTNHDHKAFEIFCYSNVAKEDEITQRLRGYADVWRDIVGASDPHVASMIREDQIDILVDLAMHTAENRLMVFARKPAPVQVAWLAYVGTTGLSTVDYRLTDAYLDPPGLFDACYSEESFRLPDCFMCYDPLVDPLPVSALPARRNGSITFGSLNNFCKVNDECLELWARVIRAVPRSRLVLVAPRDPARDRVLAKLEAEGIASSRVEFAADRVSRAEYLRLYGGIDIGLDPLPYNGHATSLDAFWMGVPTLTLVGKTVVGRAGLSLLGNLGLKELAAEEPGEFVAVATQLANDWDRLEQLRGSLRERMQQSPLMDGKRFARNLERAYREMWRRWCQEGRSERSGSPIHLRPEGATDNSQG